MSEMLLSYVISVLILNALALFIPCIELLARLMRTPLYGESETLVLPMESSVKSRKIV